MPQPNPITQDFATAGSTFTSVAVDTGPNKAYSFQVDFSGATLAGTGKVQGSNNSTSWIDITGATQTIATSASILLSTDSSGYRYARLIWTPSGGSGTATVTVFMKV